MTTPRFPHFSLRNINLGKSAKLRIKSASIPSSFSSIITTLSEELSSSTMKTWFYLKLKLERVIIYERSFLHFILYQIFLNKSICFFSSVEIFINKIFDSFLASIKEPQNDLLIKTMASPLMRLYLYLKLIGEERTEC